MGLFNHKKNEHIDENSEQKQVPIVTESREIKNSTKNDIKTLTKDTVNNTLIQLVDKKLVSRIQDELMIHHSKDMIESLDNPEIRNKLNERGKNYEP
ncbi:hypothetical protein GPU58_08145 [Streptococcus thermophilus]|nr:hypothetical protein [Streptococcus thermophilus]